MDLSKITTGNNPPDDINVLIEVPLGGDPIKYEIDKASGAMFVDRYLYTEMRYPCNYGFVPHTLSLDGDPIDTYRRLVRYRKSARTHFARRRTRQESLRRAAAANPWT